MTLPPRPHPSAPIPPPCQADENKGITDEQAEALRAQFGFNELPEKKINPFHMFLGYLWGPMPCMIWAAIIIELIKVGLVGEGVEDVVVLFVLQFANATGAWGAGQGRGRERARAPAAHPPDGGARRDGALSKRMAPLPVCVRGLAR